MDRARLALALLAISATAAAHTEKFPKRDRLQLSAGGARLAIDYLIPGDEARALREVFDRDHSGALDDKERAQLGEYLAQQAARFAALTVDGAPVALARAGFEPELGAGGETPIAVTVRLAAPLALGPGRHHVRFADRHKDRRVTVPVAVALDGLSLATPLAPQPFVFDEHPLDFDVAR
jgi:hypothetical protein